MADQIPHLLGSRITALCDIRVPVFQGALPGFAGPELAAAVSSAGGLGHLSDFYTDAESLLDAIIRTHQLTTQPFGVYLMPQHSDFATFKRCIGAVIQGKPRVLTLAYGYYGDAIRKVRAAGICVAVQVRNSDEARKALRAGAQILIAQGEEAAGYIPGQLGLMALLPELLELAGDVPVIAAGSVHDSAAVRGVMAMGAAGVWCTAGFAVCEESSAGTKVKQRLLTAGTVSERLCCEPVPDEKQQYNVGGKAARQGGLLRRFLSSEQPGDPEEHPLRFYWGQGLGRIKEAQPAARLLASLAEAFR